MKLSYSSVLAFASIVAGQVMLHPNTAFNKCLEVRGDVRANGTAVQMSVIFIFNNVSLKIIASASTVMELLLKCGS